MYEVRYTNPTGQIKVPSADRDQAVRTAVAVSTRYRDQWVEIWRIAEDRPPGRIIAESKNGCIYVRGSH